MLTCRYKFELMTYGQKEICLWFKYYSTANKKIRFLNEEIWKSEICEENRTTLF